MRGPLHDGGLFYLMTEELRRSHYLLPAFTAYNQAGIPFAYPPLGFYLAGLLADLAHWPLLDLFRLLPSVISLAAIPAFYRLARALLPARAAACAVVAYSLLPGSYAWQIMGGGIPRSLGFLFAVLAIDQVYRLYTRPQARHVLLAILWAAGTVLSHLAMAWLVAVSSALLFVAYGRHRAGLLRSLLVAVGTAALTSPWWVTVIARHGLAPFVAARGSPAPMLAGLERLATLDLSGELYFPLLASLALLGLLVCLVRRRYLLPAWVALLFLADPRTATTIAPLPLGLLAGVGTADLLLPALDRGRSAGPAGEATGTAGTGGIRGNLLAEAVLALGIVYCLVTGLVGRLPLVTALSSGEREAMAWVAGHTPQDATFLVVTGDRLWGVDRSSEWFPVLAGRRSAATVQGTEWLPEFRDDTIRYVALQRCAAQGASCLAAWAEEEGVTFTDVYVAKRPGVDTSSGSTPCCTGLEDSLRHDPGYEVIYDGPGAVIFSLRAPAVKAASPRITYPPVEPGTSSSPAMHRDRGLES